MKVVAQKALMIDLNHSRNLALLRRAGWFRISLPLPVLIAALGSLLAGQVTAQTMTTLYNFKSNDDGAVPEAGLILSGDTLYGTTTEGGSLGGGTAFSVDIDGTGFTPLHEFDGNPRHSLGFSLGTLVMSNNNLYGTTESSVFAINTDGTGFTTLHNFTALTPYDTNYINGGGNVVSTNRDGAEPTTGLVLSGDTLFGTAYGGGDFGNGTVFSVKTDGTEFTTLHSFTASYTNSYGTYTNSDGAQPVGGLFFSGDTLEGTTISGGSSGDGTIFSISLPAITLPQLTITPSERNVVLTWQTNFTGFTLQSTTNLGLAAIWATNLPAPVIVNGRNTVINPISSAQQFFRLSQ